MPQITLRVRSWNQNQFGASIFTEMGFIPCDNADLASRLVGTEVTVEYSEKASRTVGGKDIVVDGQTHRIGGRQVPTLVGAKIVDFAIPQAEAALLAKAEKLQLKPHAMFVRAGNATVTTPAGASGSLKTATLPV